MTTKLSEHVPPSSITGSSKASFASFGLLHTIMNEEQHENHVCN